MTIHTDPNAAHAVYAPSSAHRWVYCTASALAIAMLPPQEDDDNEDSVAGTAAHDEIDRILCQFNGQVVGPDQIRAAVKSLLDVEHPAAFGIALAIDYLAKLPRGRVWIEQRVALTDQIWGRCDICHWHEETGVLTIIDYKNGKRAVDAEENEQLRIYGAGSMFTHKLPVKWLRYVVVQPNDWRPFVPRVKQWYEPVASLYAWAEKVAAIPLGIKKFTAGEHCRDCPLFGRCDDSLDMLANIGPFINGLVQPGDVRPEQVAKFLAMQKPIEDAFKGFKKLWEKKALKSEIAPPDMKLVESVTHRAWKSEQEARAAIIAAKGTDALKLPTVAQAEEMGIDVSKLHDKPRGVPALAFAHDSRKDWKRQTGAEMFAGVPIPKSA